MIASFIIVLREVFEVALIISIALAASRGLAGSRRAILMGCLAGLAGALVLASATGWLGETLEGMGPDVFNAGVLLAAVLMLSWHHIWMQRHGAAISNELKSVGGDVRAGARPLGALATVVALAALREGAEVVLFLYGVAAGGTTAGPMMIGGLLGLAGGAAAGTLLYLGLMRIPPRYLFAVTGWMLLFLAAGMAAQAAAFLVQSGWLPAIVEPVWDTSSLLPQQSLPGQLLHALAGYDDRPSGVQLLFFCVTFASVLLLSWIVNGRKPSGARVPAIATLIILAAAAVVAAPRAEAADKVYSPIVEEGERAIELRGHRESDGDPGVDDGQQYKVDLEFSPRWFWSTELVGEWEKAPGESLKNTEVAWENIFQLFEQGRYAIDAGLLVEYAHSTEPGGEDKLELGALLQKDFGLNQMRFNLVAERELRSGAETELEYALQYRWRRSPRFEPGIEWYGEFGDLGDFGSLGDHRHELGPAAFGRIPLGSGALKYEFAWLFGLTEDAAAQTARFLLEYEF
ncbi:MAG: FTR1 family protein [Steroidobacteraceae bacterium]